MSWEYDPVEDDGEDWNGWLDDEEFYDGAYDTYDDPYVQWTEELYQTV